MKVTLLDHPGYAEWMTVKQAALVTIGKRAITPPDQEWKHKMLVARHSPIRELKIQFLLEDIPYWLSTEFSRHHEGCQPYIKSQRNDRQKSYDRNAARQDAPVSMIWTFNAEGFMTVCNKRLCRLATKEAQVVVAEMARQLEEMCPEFVGVLVPMCYQQGHKCHELYGCGLCEYDPMM